MKQKDAKDAQDQNAKKSLPLTAAEGTPETNPRMSAKEMEELEESLNQAKKKHKVDEKAERKDHLSAASQPTRPRGRPVTKPKETEDEVAKRAHGPSRRLAKAAPSSKSKARGKKKQESESGLLESEESDSSEQPEPSESESDSDDGTVLQNKKAAPTAAAESKIPKTIKTGDNEKQPKMVKVKPSTEKEKPEKMPRKVSKEPRTARKGKTADEIKKTPKTQQKRGGDDSKAEEPKKDIKKRNEYREELEKLRRRMREMEAKVEESEAGMTDEDGENSLGLVEAKRSKIEEPTKKGKGAKEPKPNHEKKGAKSEGTTGHTDMESPMEKPKSVKERRVRFAEPPEVEIPVKKAKKREAAAGSRAAEGPTNSSQKRKSALKAKEDAQRPEVEEIPAKKAKNREPAEGSEAAAPAAGTNSRQKRKSALKVKEAEDPNDMADKQKPRKEKSSKDKKGSTPSTVLPSLAERLAERKAKKQSAERPQEVEEVKEVKYKSQDMTAHSETHEEEKEIQWFCVATVSIQFPPVFLFTRSRILIVELKHPKGVKDLSIYSILCWC